MEIPSTYGSSNQTVIDKEDSGFNGLTAEHFMKLLITELQNQDPLEPMGNEQMLNQISMMRNLQSNIELSDTLKSMTSSTQLSSAAGFIGKNITGVDLNNTVVEGTVDRAFMADGKAYVAIGQAAIELGSVLAVDS